MLPAEEGEIEQSADQVRKITTPLPCYTYMLIYLFPDVRGYLKCVIQAAVQPSYLYVGVLSSAS